MTAPDAPTAMTLGLTAEEFEATAQRITHEWMRHLGYTDVGIAEAEAQTCEAAGCEMFGEGHWDHSDENGDSLHPERDELDVSGELVMFVMEHLVVVERDPAAELAEAVKAWASAYRHAYEDPITGFEADAAGRNLDNAEVALLAALAAYEASRK